MCTVTFIPGRDKFYLTSNRDEKSWRKEALHPLFYIHNDVQLIYPKDAEAGGTWIALNENGNAGVLLNGAFTKHNILTSYRKSRGLVFIDIIKTQKPVKGFLNIDLNNIEPFTLVLFEKKCLYECRWDGSRKYCKQITAHEPHIWSSSTLYDEDVVKKRKQWFTSWLKKNPAPAEIDILAFHQFAGDGDMSNDLLMNRDNKVFTVSITGIELSLQKAKMHYLDIKNNQSFLTQVQFSNADVSKYQYHA